MFICPCRYATFPLPSFLSSMRLHTTHEVPRPGLVQKNASHSFSQMSTLDMASTICVNVLCSISDSSFDFTAHSVKVLMVNKQKGIHKYISTIKYWWRMLYYRFKLGSITATVQPIYKASHVKHNKYNLYYL